MIDVPEPFAREISEREGADGALQIMLFRGQFQFQRLPQRRPCAGFNLIPLYHRQVIDPGRVRLPYGRLHRSPAAPSRGAAASLQPPTDRQLAASAA